MAGRPGRLVGTARQHYRPPNGGHRAGKKWPPVRRSPDGKFTKDLIRPSATHRLPAGSGEPGPIPTVMSELQRPPEQHRTSLVERFDVRDVKSIAIDVNEKYVPLPQPARVFLRAPYREISRAPVGQHR